jgi:hypothetical protein
LASKALAAVAMGAAMLAKTARARSADASVLMILSVLRVVALLSEAVLLRDRLRPLGTLRI